MTREQLDAIRRRYERAQSCGFHQPMEESMDDIPALLAEIRRLTRIEQAARNVMDYHRDGYGEIGEEVKRRRNALRSALESER